MGDWGVHDSGMISQSISDMTSGDLRIFTETAAEHNQSIHDATGATA